MTTITIHNSNR